MAEILYKVLCRSLGSIKFGESLKSSNPCLPHDNLSILRCILMKDLISCISTLVVVVSILFRLVYDFIPIINHSSN